MRKRRTLAIGCTGLVGLLSLALGGGWLYLQSDAGERRVESTLENLVAGMLEEGAIEFGELDLKGTTLTLTDVVVDGSQHDDVLVVPTIRAEVRLRSALGRTIAIESVFIDQPELVLHRLEDGAFDLPVFTSSPEPDTPSPTTWMAPGWTLDLQDLQLAAGSIDLPADDVTVNALGLSGRATATEHTLQVQDLALSWDVVQPAIGPGQLDATVTFDAEDLTRLDAVLQQGTSSATVAGSIQDLLGETLELDLQLDVVAPPRARSTLAEAFDVELPEDLLEDTDLLLEAAVGGPLDALQARAELAYDDIPDGVVFVAASGTATGSPHFDGSLWAPDLRPLRRLGAPLGAGSLQVPFTIDQQGEVLTATVDATVRSLVVDDIASVGRLAVHAEGRLSPDLDLDLELDASQVRATAVPRPLVFRMSADGHYAGTRLRTALDVDTTTSDPLALSGWIDFDTASQALEVSDLELRASDTLVVVSDGPLVASLDPDRTTLDGRLLLRADDQPAGDLDAAVALAGPRLEADVTADDIQLAPLVGAASMWVDADLPPLDGALDATVHFEDSTASPVVSLDASVARLAVDEIVAPIDATLVIDVADDWLTTDLDVRHRGRHHLTVDGSIPLVASELAPVCAPGADLTAEVLPTNLAHLRDLSPLVPELDQRVALDATLEVTGNPCDPSIALRAGAATDLLEQTVIAELTATDSPEHTLQADVGVQFAGEPALAADLRAPHPAPMDLLEADDPVSLLEDWEARARVLDVRVRSLLPDVSGRIGGSATATGSGRWVTSTEGELDWGTPGTQGFTLERVRAGWFTHEGELNADVLLLADSETNLEAQAAVDLRGIQADTADTAIELHVPPSEIPLQLLADLSAGLITEGSGVITLTADVDGTIASPDASGSFVVDNGALDVPWTGIAYEDIDIDMGFEGDTATITAGLDAVPRYGRFRNRTSDDEHQLDLSGTVQLQDDKTIAPDLVLALDDFWAIANDMATTTLDGELTVAGSATDLKVRGDLIVDDGNFDLGRHLFIPAGSDTLDDDITFAGRTPDVFVVEEDDGMSPMYLVDARVGVTIQQATRLRATFPMAADAGQIGTIGDVELDARLEGDLDVAMIYGEPSVTGEIDVTGDASLLTAEFGIQQGTLAFIGADIAEPTIDLTLERSGTSGDVTAVIAGTPTDLQIERLSSSRGLTDADILAQFLFGRPLSDLGEGESATAAVAVQQALLSVAGSSVENSLGVGLVDSVDYSDDGLALGWSVGDDGFLTVSVDPTAEPDENVAQVTLSWLLGSMTQAELQTGDAGESAAWVRLETRF